MVEHGLVCGLAWRVRKNFKVGDSEPAAGGTVPPSVIDIEQGISNRSGKGDRQVSEGQEGQEGAGGRSRRNPGAGEAMTHSKDEAAGRDACLAGPRLQASPAPS